MKALLITLAACLPHGKDRSPEMRYVDAGLSITGVLLLAFTLFLLRS